MMYHISANIHVCIYKQAMNSAAIIKYTSMNVYHHKKLLVREYNCTNIHVNMYAKSVCYVCNTFATVNPDLVCRGRLDHN